jgi:GNAT superfamily N-acetyltransferase
VDSAPRVRAARPEDADVLTELCGQLGYPGERPDVEARLLGLLAHPDRAVFVVEVDGRPAGWIQVSLSRLLECPLSAEVGGLVVEARHRSRGLGPMLLAAGDAWARERGCHRMRVPCNVVRADAHRFYEREGFREVKRQRIFERPV